MKILILVLSLLFMPMPAYPQDKQALAKADSLSVVEKEHIEDLKALKDSILNYVLLEKYEDALHLSLKTLSLIENNYGMQSLDYLRELRRCSSLFSRMGNHEKAMQYTEKELEISETLYGKNSSEYLFSLSSLNHIYLQLEDYSKCISIKREMLSIYKILDRGKEDFINLWLTYRSLSLYETKLFHFSEAIVCENMCLKLVEEYQSVNSPYYANSLSSLSMLYYEIGNFRDAIQMQQKALEINKNIFGPESDQYVSLLQDLALIYSAMGQEVEALRILQKCVAINKKNEKELIDAWGPEYYVSSLINLSNQYYTLGDVNKAVQIAQEALSYLGNRGNSAQKASILSNLAMCYAKLGAHDEAIRLDLEALKIRKVLLGEEHPDYAVSLNHIAINYEVSGAYQDAINTEKKVLAIYEKVYGKSHLNNVNPLSNLARFYWGMLDYEEAIRLNKEANQICKDLLGSSNSLYQMGLWQLSGILFDARRYEDVIPLAREVFFIQKDLTRKLLRQLGSKERSLYWNNHNNFMGSWLPNYAYYINSDELSSIVYDASLFRKGLLLGTDVEMSEIILNSEDPKIISLYEKMCMDQLLLDNILQQSFSGSGPNINVDSLENVINQVEVELIENSKVYGDFTRNMDIDYQDVQQRLELQDAAIEFLEFPIKNDSVIYAALLLKRTTNPRLIPLFEKKQLERIPKTNYYVTNALTDLIWKPLASELQDVRNVYFAPDGELYNIAIESLPAWDGDGGVSDKRNLYRLSSTRELALIKNKNNIKAASVYGGLKYNADEQVLINDNKKYPVKRDFEVPSIADSLNLRSGVEELPATKTEAVDIDKTLTQAKVANLLYTDTLGTEASFKALSGQKRNLLHIATHGFYWTKREAQSMDHLGFLSLDNSNQPRYVEDKAMTRSGLLFSGANHALKGKALPKGVDDGILTAKEISTLDLRGLDMVVLSACQTGLGEISGDGVFGLQRGFKKAGANTLLMSLWKVDDNATQMLMTQFYLNLTSGKSKFESLREAQRYVREYETEVTESEFDNQTAYQQYKSERNNEEEALQPELTIRKIKPYASPRYWAAFILLDAVN